MVGITVAVGVPVVMGATDVAAIAIGRILAVALEAADWGCTGTVWGLTAAGLEAMGRMLAVLGASEGEALVRSPAAATVGRETWTCGWDVPVFWYISTWCWSW